MYDIKCISGVKMCVFTYLTVDGCTVRMHQSLCVILMRVL